MDILRISSVAVIAIELMLTSSPVTAGPSAEVAKRCMHYSYVVYPYKRPGAVRMSGDRQAYFKDCMAKDGEVPTPTAPPKPQITKTQMPADLKPGPENDAKE